MPGRSISWSAVAVLTFTPPERLPPSAASAGDAASPRPRRSRRARASALAVRITELDMETGSTGPCGVKPSERAVDGVVGGREQGLLGGAIGEGWAGSGGAGDL